MYRNRLHAWWSTQLRLATLLSSLIAAGGSDFRLYYGSDIKTYLLMRWWGPDDLAVCWAHRVYLLDFFCSGIQFYLLLSPYLCFLSLLYLDLYVLGDDTLISKESIMQTKYLCVMIHI